MFQISKLRVGLVAVLWIAAGAVAASADPVLTGSGTSHWNLAPDAQYLREGENEPTIDEVSSPAMAAAFKPLDSRFVNFGLQRKAFWLRAEISNPHPETETFYVVVDNERLKRVDFYAPGMPAPETHEAAGTQIPFAERSLPYRKPVFRITLAPNQEETIYLRVYHRGSLRFGLLLWEHRPFVTEHALETGMSGMFYGALAIMFVANLIIAALFRERSNLLLSAVIFCVAGYMAVYQRLDAQYLWPHSPDITGYRLNVVFGLGLCSLFLFTRDFLGTAKNAPRWDRVYLVFAALGLSLCLSIVADNAASDWLMHIVGALSPAVLLTGAFIRWRQGDRFALGYLIAWGGMFLTMIPFALQSAGLLPQSFLIEEAPKVAFPLALCLNSIGLWQRFRDLQRDYAANLKRQVKERTHELEEALAQVKTLTGLVPICSHCKKIRDDSGYWNSLERYIEQHTEANFTHGICPNCAHEIYGDVFEEPTNRP